MFNQHYGSRIEKARTAIGSEDLEEQGLIYLNEEITQMIGEFIKAVIIIISSIVIVQTLEWVLM